MGLRKLLMALALVAASMQVHARNLTTEEKLADFHYFISIISAGYGPLQFKVNTKVVDFAQLNARFEKEISQTATNRDFYYKMIEYVASYHDGHFGMKVPTTKIATVPVVTDLVDGKVLITKIDREKLKESQFAFSVGDEIVSVDGTPINAVLDNLSKYIGSGHATSVRRIASWSVFSRRGERLPLPNAKTIKVEIRRGTSLVIESAELEWNVEGQDLEDVLPPSQVMMPMRVNPSGTPALNYDRLDNDDVQAFVHPNADKNFICSGETRIDIPKDATIIAKKPFVAYFHPTPKGNVGYLRIPHYMPEAEPGKTQAEAFALWNKQYEYAVRELEKNTVGLIIDQDHNCGGSVEIVHQMIARFMTQPFTPSQFELLGTRESYFDFQKWIKEDTAENTIEREYLNRVLDLIKDTWVKGVSFLTPKTSIDGNQTFQPAMVRYTKPVVILIDELAGSGGDMFPAMMQGLGRAKLFGQNTSGLGGHVEDNPSGLPFSQLRFRMTKSLFYRPDGVPVENNGAAPDQAYTITRDDILYGFKNYQREYIHYLLGMIP